MKSNNHIIIMYLNYFAPSKNIILETKQKIFILILVKILKN